MQRRTYRCFASVLFTGITVLAGCGSPGPGAEPAGDETAIAETQGLTVVTATASGSENDTETTEPQAVTVKTATVLGTENETE